MPPPSLSSSTAAARASAMRFDEAVAVALSWPVHARRDSELQRVIRPAGPDQLISRERQAARLRPFLQRGLRVARRPLHLVDQRPPEPADKGRRRVEPAIEIDRRDHRLADIGEDAGIGARPRPPPRRATGPDERSSPIASATRASASRAHEMRQAPGQVPFRLGRRTAATADPR